MKQLLILAFAVWLLPSCKVMKTASVTTRDSVVIKYHDSTVVNHKTVMKDSVVMRDSVIGIKGNSTSLELQQGSDEDTTIEQGNVNLHRYVDKNGTEHIDCKADSLTLVVKNLTYEKSVISNTNDSLTKQINSSAITHSKETVKVQQLSWFGRLWASVEKIFAWFGLGCLVALIIILWKKFAT